MADGSVRTLLIVIALLVVGMAAAAALVPATMEEPAPDHRPPSDIGVREVTVGAHAVTGGSATLNVTTYLRHRGGPSSNVSVTVRATSGDSGLVERTVTRELGTVRGTRERTVTHQVTVPREGDHRIAVLVYADGERVDRSETTVAGVESLTPEYARSGVQFRTFGPGESAPPPVQYAVTRTDGNRVTLNVSAYIENRGDVTSDVRLRIAARQVDSNVIAASNSVSVGEIRAGRVATPDVELRVPDGYNYYLDAYLLRDGVIIGTAQGAARLNPNITVDVDRGQGEDGLRVSDFTTEEPTPEPRRERAERRTTAVGGPGFGALVALFGAVGAALLAVKRRRSP